MKTRPLPQLFTFFTWRLLNVYLSSVFRIFYLLICFCSFHFTKIIPLIVERVQCSIVVRILNQNNLLLYSFIPKIVSPQSYCIQHLNCFSCYLPLFLNHMCILLFLNYSVINSIYVFPKMKNRRERLGFHILSSPCQSTYINPCTNIMHMYTHPHPHTLLYTLILSSQRIM